MVKKKKCASLTYEYLTMLKFDLYVEQCPNRSIKQ